jgi:predicted helicase
MKLKTPRPHQKASIGALETAPIGQIILPTGTGKSLIQAHSIVNNILNSNVPKVYAILSPRILLSNQLLDDVREHLLGHKISAQYLMVHSGGKHVSNEQKLLEKQVTGQYRELKSTTSKNVIKEEYERAQREGVPLVIAGTYHSASKIKNAHIPVEILY